MSEVKWIKLSTSIFDNRKIRQIEKMPEGDALIVIWLKLLILAGNVNDGGLVYFTKEIPYTDQLLATQFDRPLSVIQLALNTFLRFGMIEVIDELLYISNWEKYQSVDKLEQIRESNRLRQRRFRERHSLLTEGQVCQYCGEPATGVDHIVAIARGGTNDESNLVPCCVRCNRIKNDKPLVDFLNNNQDIISRDIVNSNEKLAKYVSFNNVTSRYIVTARNGTDIDVDKEQDKDIDLSTIMSKWNELGLSTVRDIKGNRKTLLQARIKEHGIDAVIEALDKVADSDFLRGQNDSGWTITFDWFVRPQNFQKVLEGNYVNRKKKGKITTPSSDDYADLYSMLKPKRDIDKLLDDLDKI